MIELNDLRLGNYVAISPKHNRWKSIYKYVKPYPGFFQPILKVSSIINTENIWCIDIYEIHETTVANYMLEGILFSPEVLPKCGFNKYQKNKIGGWWQYKNNQIVLEVWDGGFHFVYHQLNVVIKYLHHLQNLYHSLIGVELEIEFA